jgi:peptide-methionine (S)-S-oxide reductase
MENNSGKIETAVLGGGCFWCLEAAFSRTMGVQDVVSGYAGGKVKDPSYEEVSGGGTGHAEVVQIHFDPSQISFEDILGIYFTIHDPTTLNRQGHDVGTQYRSVIFYLNDEQKKTAEKIMKELTEQKLYEDPIVTELLPLDTFYAAEDYHQHYFSKNPEQAYCQIVIMPKLIKFREKFKKFYK